MKLVKYRFFLVQLLIFLTMSVFEPVVAEELNQLSNQISSRKPNHNKL